MPEQKHRPSALLAWLVPLVFCLTAVAAAYRWLNLPPPPRIDLRAPGADRPAAAADSAPPMAQTGVLTAGAGQPSALPGQWPWFRGPKRDAVTVDGPPLAAQWGTNGPPLLWAVAMGEGYAAAAVYDGCVYVLDYDRARQADALRCLSLDDGREIWRYAYPVAVKRNHGMSRTIPAIDAERVVALGPKCHVTALDRRTGARLWALDLAREWGATVPPWYAGQNPLIEDHRVVLAPGGPEALLLAVAAADGKPVWRTPNPRGWKMTHSSIVPLDFHGRRLYLYCASGGVVAVDATNGVPVWSTDQWKISIATVPSPVVIPPDRILLAGGYNAGSLMVRLSDKDGVIAHTVEWRAKAEVFGSDQQTPVVYRDHIYGVKAGGQMACLTLAGAVRWTSGPAHVFGLGPYLIADGKIFALNDEGVLTLLEAQPDAFRPLTSAKVLSGHDAWGPLALVNGRLILRDFTRMICLDVAQR